MKRRVRAMYVWKRPAMTACWDLLIFLPWMRVSSLLWAEKSSKLGIIFLISLKSADRWRAYKGHQSVKCILFSLWYPQVHDGLGVLWQIWKRCAFSVESFKLSLVCSRGKKKLALAHGRERQSEKYTWKERDQIEFSVFSNIMNPKTYS